ncbi:glycoside hydrolase/deacetylase, partial [Agrocybe pediades]
MPTAVVATSAGAALSNSATGAAIPPGTVAGTTPTPVVAGTPPAATGTDIPALSLISSGMPTRTARAAATTHSPGAQLPISGAPKLPTLVTAVSLPTASYPAENVVPGTNSPQVQQWMKELDGFNIPDLQPTVDGSCASDPQFAADSANRGWWTCRGVTRDTDIVACPDKFTWGVSFDDGPSPYILFSQYVLDFLQQKNLSATFFVVGSRILERPQILVQEYMAGHEVSVHTWSHSKPLTSLTNAELVAELGWTRQIIKDVIGVTPTTMRPPWGDIDDRVRAVSMAMGMIPVIWTRSPSGSTFDTNDWKVAGGQGTAADSFNTFQTILSQASQMETGFVVLEHDLFEVTVDIAIGYTL